MRNNRGETHTAGVPEHDLDARLAREGYEDRRRGLGYRVEYDAWPDDAQGAYEAGRRVAAALQRYYRELPGWPLDRTFPEIFPAAVPVGANAALVIENELTAKGTTP